MADDTRRARLGSRRLRAERGRARAATTVRTGAFVGAALAVTLGVTGCVGPPHQAANEPDPPTQSRVESFEARCQGVGVIRCVGFDSESEVAGHLTPDGEGKITARVDTEVKASGAGSLRFEIPSYSGANTSGSFWLNFADDLSRQFGEGGEFYIQWRQRFSPEMLVPFAGGGGFKQVIVGEGDRPGKKASSCTEIELVVNNAWNRGFPQMYHSCGDKDGRYAGLQEPVSGPEDYRLQNAIRGCLYTLSKRGGRSVPPCHGYQANAWMTFQIHVKVGGWYRNDRRYRHDSTIQFWIGDEGKPSQLVIDFSPKNASCQAIQVSDPPCQTGYDLVNTNPAAKYGKLWLMPYNTGKDRTRSYPIAYTWYDDLIISTARIADP
jgi:hypothetical protein